MALPRLSHVSVGTRSGWRGLWVVAHSCASLPVTCSKAARHCEFEDDSGMIERNECSAAISAESDTAQAPKAIDMTGGHPVID